MEAVPLEEGEVGALVRVAVTDFEMECVVVVEVVD